MTTFTVEWTIEIEARAAEEAGRRALDTLRATVDSVSHVHHFDVYADPRDLVEGGICHHVVSIEHADRAPRAAALADSL